jgi:hypothetical protein
MRDRDQLVLDAIAGRRPNGRNQVRANCPFCETAVGKVDRKQCLSLDAASGWWKCFRCDTRGKLEDLPFDIGTLKPRDKDEEAKPVNMPEGFVPLWKPEGLASMTCKPALKYLATRVDARTIEQARIGCCVRGSFNGRVVVPIYKAGKLAGYVGRLWKKRCGPNDRKYLYNEGFSRADVLYNEDALYVTTEEPAIIVEGVFDTFPFFPNGVAVLGKPSPAQFDMMCNARRPMLIVFDGDAHREATALAMHLRLAGKRAAALRLGPGIDPDECVDHVKQQARAAFEAA